MDDSDDSHEPDGGTTGEPGDDPGDDPGDALNEAPDGASPGPQPNRLRIVLGGALLVAVVLIVAVLLAGSRQTEATAAAPEAPPGTDAPPATRAPGTTAETLPGETTTTLKPRRVPTGPPGPLTNTAVDLPGYENRPALVVKIDNLDGMARPQAGITLADVVYEERVEGGLTRFAAVFHGADSDEIGPVRSARSTDLGITEQLNRPLFAYSGANGSFQGMVHAADLIDVGAGAAGGAYYREGWRPAPHNLFTSTAALYRTRGYGPPEPLWAFRGRDDGPGPGARAVSGAAMSFGAGIPIGYTWDPEQAGWRRTQNGTPHLDSDGYQVIPQNVLVQYVDYVSSGVNDASGNPIPEAVLLGSGRGLLLTGGAALDLSWVRLGPGLRTVYYGPDGNEVRLAPGRTWVELLPSTSGVQLYR